MQEKLFQIQLEKCLVILTGKEISILLQKNTEIFERALKRGKVMKRSKLQREREEAKFSNETGGESEWKKL
jgi:hypothetical protein